MSVRFAVIGLSAFIGHIRGKPERIGSYEMSIKSLEAREFDDAHFEHVASWAEKLAAITSAEMENCFAFFPCDSARNFNIVRRTDRFGI